MVLPNGLGRCAAVTANLLGIALGSAGPIG
jgi:hypothetical protein